MTAKETTATDATLAAIGTSLGNISAAIAAHQLGDEPAFEAFSGFVDAEIRRLRAEGQGGIAGALSAFRAPAFRYLREGW